jgi:hypothetical protein
MQVFSEGPSDDLEGHRSAADGARNFVARYEIFAHCSIMHSVPECNLDADQHIGKKAPRGFACRRLPGLHASPCFPQSFMGRIQPRINGTSLLSADTRAHAQRGIDYNTLAGQTNSLLDSTYIKAGSFHLLFYVMANRKLAV